jgi:hypothetical protein
LYDSCASIAMPAADAVIRVVIAQILAGDDAKRC